MDIGDLFSGDSFLNELLSEVVIHIELAVVVRRGQITEDHLCGSVLRCALPNIKDIIGAGRDFAGFTIGEHIIHQSLVERQLPAVVGNQKHIIGGGIHHLISDTLRTVGKPFHHLFLSLRWFQNNIVIMRLWHR